MLRGTNHQRVEYVAAQSPGVGVADVVDPASDAGVEVSFAELAGVESGEPSP